MPDFIPANDAAFLGFVQPMSTKITATPTAFGLSASIATALATKVTAFSAALAAATDPLTRGEATILAKHLSREDLEFYVREVARQVQGTISVTAAQRQSLGLTVKDTQPTPIPPPANAPEIVILSAVGNTVKLRLRDSASPTRRGRPAGVDGASVFSFVGATAPTAESEWTFEGVTSRTKIDITFADSVEPGSRVWFTAFWFNARKQNGPATAPIGTNLPGGGAMAA